MPRIDDDPHITGVYAIVNLVNGKMYVGGAYKSFKLRFSLHLKALTKGTHGNEHLQSAWNKYGSDNFLFKVLERCSPKRCKEREQHWIDKTGVVNRNLGYNKSPTAGSPLGVKHSGKSRANFSAAMRKRMELPEERMKMGKAMRGKKHSKKTIELLKKIHKEHWKDPEFREKVIRANTGKKRTEETKVRISKALTGRKFSDAHKDAISKSKSGVKQSKEAIEKRASKIRGKKRSAETIAKIRATNTGKKRSDESKAKMKEGQRKRFLDPVKKAKMKHINLGRKASEETKKKMSESQRRPETRAKKVAAAKAQWARIKEQQND